MQDGEWSWVGEDGIEHQGNNDQLTRGLSSEQIPAYTLVSKSTWRDWLPAMQVAELHWALPAGLADAARAPVPRLSGAKRPPPMGDYPALRQRALELRQNGSVSSQPEHPSSPYQRSGPSSPSLHDLQKYGEDDFDEPTVQIDADQLERALSESRVDDPLSSQPSISSIPPRSPAPRGHDIPLMHKMPTYPGFIPTAPPPSSDPGIPGYDSPPPPAYAPAPAEPLPAPYPSEPLNAFGGHEPTLTSRIETGPPASQSARLRSNKGKLLLLLGLMVGAGVAAGVLVHQHQAAQPKSGVEPPSSVNMPVPQSPAKDEQRPTQCVVDQSLQLSEFAHVQIPPSVGEVPGSERFALGFAQTSRLAVGVTLDPSSMDISRLFSESQNSPLWSVVPVVDGNDLKFRTSRAASTLRSINTIPSQPPLYFGLSREGLAVRGDNDPVDRVLWKSEWDTITIPQLQRLDDQTFVTALRAGGERGKIVVGKINSGGEALGELQTLVPVEGRLDAPALVVSANQIFVVFSAGSKAPKDVLYLARSPASTLPFEGKPILTESEGITSPQLTALGGGKLLLQYTQGTTGSQRVVVRALDANQMPEGEPLVVSPEGRDAYEGIVLSRRNYWFSVYFVRQEQGHELWISRLVCK